MISRRRDQPSETSLQPKDAEILLWTVQEMLSLTLS